jgi:hypothetical protein
MKVRNGTKGGLMRRGRGRGGRGNTWGQAQARAKVEGGEDGGRLARTQRRRGARDVRGL